MTAFYLDGAFSRISKTTSRSWF